MNLDSKRLDIIGSVGSSREVREVELDLVPALIESHGHRTDEWLYACSGLVVTGSEPPANVLVVKNLHFEREVFLQLS